MDYTIMHGGADRAFHFSGSEFASNPADKQALETSPHPAPVVGNLPWHRRETVDTTMPTSRAAPSETKEGGSLSRRADLPPGSVSNAMAKALAHIAFFERHDDDVATLLQRDFAITDRQMQETVDPVIAVGIAERAWQTEGALVTESTRWRRGDTRFNTRVEDAFIAMMPAHWRGGESWALSLSEDASLSLRIRDSAKALFRHFERDTLDLIQSLPEKTDGALVKFRGLYSIIAQVQAQSAWFDLWHRAREMPWYVQPALMHRLAIRLPCNDTSVAENAVLTEFYDRWRDDMFVDCIVHDSGLLLARAYAAVIEALSHLFAFDTPHKMPLLRWHVAKALRETPVPARAEVLDVLVNLDLARLGPRSYLLTQLVPSNLRYLVSDPLGRATCPSVRFAETLCDTAVIMWPVLPESGPLDEKIAAFCKRFDLGAEQAMSLQSRLSVVSREPDRPSTQTPIITPDDFDFFESTYDRTAAKL